jgi:molecular chaperone GrpE (heat shock protein)
MTAPKISKWPFFLGDAVLFLLAWFIYYQSKTPTGTVEICVYVACVAIGSWISITPFLKEYQAELKFAEADRLVSIASQIQNLDQLAAQIGYATSQWQTIRESADKTANVAKSIADGMASEVKSFNEFIHKTNEGEKSTLRLEVDKLRRAEVEWLQATVRILDHVFALHHAAVRSRQPGLAEQLGKFQMACLDVVRRLGLAPFVAAPAEAFDAQRHQLIDGPDAKAPEGATVEETVAAGYTFQGRMIRPAMVRLKSVEPDAEPEIEPTAEPVSEAAEPPAESVAEVEEPIADAAEPLADEPEPIADAPSAIETELSEAPDGHETASEPTSEPQQEDKKTAPRQSELL